MRISPCLSCLCHSGCLGLIAGVAPFLGGGIRCLLRFSLVKYLLLWFLYSCVWWSGCWVDDELAESGGLDRAAKSCQKAVKKSYFYKNCLKIVQKGLKRGQKWFKGVQMGKRDPKGVKDCPRGAKTGPIASFIGFMGSLEV